MKYYTMAINHGSNLGLYNLLTHFERIGRDDDIVPYCKYMVDNYPDNLTEHLDVVDTLAAYYRRHGKYTDGYALFTNYYDRKIDIENVTEHICRFMKRDPKLFLSLYDENKSLKQTVDQQAEYIDVLEVMPEGPKYAAAKQHFNESAALIDKS